MERAKTAEGVIWIQWRETRVAKKEELGTKSLKK